MNAPLPPAARAVLYDENGVVGGAMGTEWLIRTYRPDQGPAFSELWSAVCFSPWPGQPVDGARFGIALLDDHATPTWFRPVAAEVFQLRGAGAEGTLGWVRFDGPPRQPVQLGPRPHTVLEGAMAVQPNLRSALISVEHDAAVLGGAAPAQPLLVTTEAVAAMAVPAWSVTSAGPAELSFSICRLFRWD